MSHLDERILERLVTGTAGASEVDRILRHTSGCRACARRLEEWRDNFAEVDQSYPEFAANDRSAARMTAGGLVVVPSPPPRRLAVKLDFANALWVVALIMAVVVGYGAHRLRSADDGFAALPPGTMPRAQPPESGNGAGAPMPLAQPSDSLVRVVQRVPAPAPAAATPASRTPSPAPDPAPSRRPPATPAAASSLAPAEAAPPPAQDSPTRLPVSPRFHAVAVSDASSQLGGPLRLLRGFDPDHVEIGPATAVPGAQRGLAVVRVVYRTPDGSRMLLDQQLIPADSSGFRPIDDPTLELGATAYGTGPNGVSVATWLDEEGYRISLAVQAPVDSLKKLVQLVR